MFRIKGDAIRKNILAYFPVASTVAGMVESSDIGSLVLMTSNRAGIVSPSSHAMSLANTTSPDDGYPVPGILTGVENDETTSGSTVSKIYVQPLTYGEIIEADYSTIAVGAITRSDAYLASTNIGNYIHVLGNGTSSGSPVTARFMDASSGANIWSSTNPFQMLDYSTKNKTIDILYTGVASTLSGRLL